MLKENAPKLWLITYCMFTKNAKAFIKVRFIKHSVVLPESLHGLSLLKNNVVSESARSDVVSLRTALFVKIHARTLSP